MFDKIEMDLYTYINYVYIKYIYIRTLVHIGEWKMFGRLLGLLDPLFAILKNVIGHLIEWILSPLIENLIAPLVVGLVRVIIDTLAIFFYMISCFILGLIDFVEVLFRALAGLPAKAGAQYSATITFGGETKGDMVIQLIRNDAVQQAFLSMCIVGLFLLLVTSVFQIIKTEYTTEGAKNAKGPILNKAFRALCNLMLLPILCIFGVLFANQLLNLLDKATSSSGDNPTISGSMFVAGAADAHRKLGDEGLIANSVLITELLDDVITEAIMNALFEEPEYSEEQKLEYENKIKEIESNFMSQKEGYQYSNLKNVSTYYKLYDINYIVIILGSVMVLKALFFACFGMILRLYKCAMLFIISPVVIGMTPINEGGLGKWRGQFIGQVLSAYGVIISVNLFLILVRVMLNVEVEFHGEFVLSNSMMTGLLKALLVIAGASLIEKFAKDIGAFFGAEDAISGGKDMAKSIGDTAMAGVVAAGAVAGGGAMIARKAIGMGKAVGGIANKLGIGEGKAVKKAGDAAYNESFEQYKREGYSLKEAEDKAEEDRAAAETKARDDFRANTYAGRRADAKFAKGKDASAMVGESVRMQKAMGLADAWNASGEELMKFGLDDKLAKVDNNSKLSEDKKKEKRAAIQAQYDKLKEKNSSIHDQLVGMGYGDSKKDIESLKKSNDKDIARMDRAAKNAEERKQRWTEPLNTATMYGAGFMQGALDDTVGKLPGMGRLTSLDKMAMTGMGKMGDTPKATADHIKKQREKRVEDSYENDPLVQASARAMQVGGAMVITRKAMEDLGNTIANSIKQLEGNRSYYKDRLDQYKDNTDSAEYKSVLSAFVDDVRNNYNGDITTKQAEALIKGEIKITADNIGIKSDPKVINQAVEAALAKHKPASPEDVSKVIAQALQEQLGNKGGMSLMLLIEKLFKEHMQ